MFTFSSPRAGEGRRLQSLRLCLLRSHAGQLSKHKQVGGCGSSGVSSGPVGSQVAMTHEIGHACGLLHGPCGSVGTSADPNYPAYPPYDSAQNRAASIGEYGLDITTGNIPTPDTAKDYMSYCGPQWISLYNNANLLNNEALNPQSVGTVYPWLHPGHSGNLRYRARRPTPGPPRQDRRLRGSHPDRRPRLRRGARYGGCSQRPLCYSYETAVLKKLAQFPSAESAPRPKLRPKRPANPHAPVLGMAIEMRSM
jgi:hypothetical protein